LEEYGHFLILELSATISLNGREYRPWNLRVKGKKFISQGCQSARVYLIAHFDKSMSWLTP
jgi:hypothetical protein